MMTLQGGARRFSGRTAGSTFDRCTPRIVASGPPPRGEPGAIHIPGKPGPSGCSIWLLARWGHAAPCTLRGSTALSAAGSTSSRARPRISAHPGHSSGTIRSAPFHPGCFSPFRILVHLTAPSLTPSATVRISRKPLGKRPRASGTATFFIDPNHRPEASA